MTYPTLKRVKNWLLRWPKADWATFPKWWFLCVSFIIHPASPLTANKWLCVCRGIRITLRYVSLSLHLSFIPLPSSQPSHCGSSCPAPPPPVSPPSLLLCGVCLLCAYCRLALDDAIRHKQLNISRFSPRVAGENDFLQTVINKVITAKEVNHKGQGTVQGSKQKLTLYYRLLFICFMKCLKNKSVLFVSVLFTSLDRYQIPLYWLLLTLIAAIVKCYYLGRGEKVSAFVCSKHNKISPVNIICN